MISRLKYDMPRDKKGAPLPEKPKPAVTPQAIPATTLAVPEAKPLTVPAPTVKTPAAPAPRTTEPNVPAATVDDAAALEEIAGAGGEQVEQGPADTNDKTTPLRIEHRRGVVRCVLVKTTVS